MGQGETYCANCDHLWHVLPCRELIKNDSLYCRSCNHICHSLMPNCCGVKPGNKKFFKKYGKCFNRIEWDEMSHIEKEPVKRKFKTTEVVKKHRTMVFEEVQEEEHFKTVVEKFPQKREKFLKDPETIPSEVLFSQRKVPYTVEVTKFVEKREYYEEPVEVIHEKVVGHKLVEKKKTVFWYQCKPCQIMHQLALKNICACYKCTCCQCQAKIKCGCRDYVEKDVSKERHEMGDKELFDEKELKKDELTIAFETFNKKGDGKMTRMELETTMKELEIEVSQNDLDTMMSEGDPENKGYITVEGFRNIMK